MLSHVHYISMESLYNQITFPHSMFNIKISQLILWSIADCSIHLKNNLVDLAIF